MNDLNKVYGLLQPLNTSSATFLLPIYLEGLALF